MQTDDIHLPTDTRVTCPHCGQLVEPKESDTPAGTLLICPECYKLIGRA